jgi:hypothetical protein
VRYGEQAKQKALTVLATHRSESLREDVVQRINDVANRTPAELAGMEFTTEVVAAPTLGSRSERQGIGACSLQMKDLL